MAFHSRKQVLITLIVFGKSNNSCIQRKCALQEYCIMGECTQHAKPNPMTVIVLVGLDRDREDCHKWNSWPKSILLDHIDSTKSFHLCAFYIKTSYGCWEKKNKFSAKPFYDIKNVKNSNKWSKLSCIQLLLTTREKSAQFAFILFVCCKDWLVTKQTVGVQ